jgi:hypothetical protein
MTINQGQITIFHKISNGNYTRKLSTRQNKRGNGLSCLTSLLQENKPSVVPLANIDNLEELMDVNKILCKVLIKWVGRGVSNSYKIEDTNKLFGLDKKLN